MLIFHAKGGEEDEKFVIYSDDGSGFPAIYSDRSKRAVLLDIPAIMPLAGGGGDEGASGG